MPKRTATKKSSVPTPVKIDSRICFAIEYFTSEEDAQAYAAIVQQRGDTYNGGWYHGMACGREKTWDYVDDTLGPLFAVTS
jgi:uncharacterized protein with NRDE domain